MNAPLLDRIAVAIRTDGRAPAERAKTALAPVVDEIVEAQADLQTALGQVRLLRRNGPAEFSHRLGPVERVTADALARLHTLLAELGRPMATRDTP